MGLGAVESSKCLGVVEEEEEKRIESPKVEVILKVGLVRKLARTTTTMLFWKGWSEQKWQVRLVSRSCLPRKMVDEL